VATQIVPFGIETLTAYELGAKSEWFDHSLRANVSVFFDKYNQIQETLLSCPQFNPPSAPDTPCAAPVNGGDADIYGAELELAYHLGGLSVDGSYSHQQFEFKSVNASTGILIGNSVPGFQSNKWSVGAQYEQRLPNAATVTPRLDFIYAAGYYTNASNDPQSYLAGYHMMNGRITYKPDGPSGTWRWPAPTCSTSSGTPRSSTCPRRRARCTASPRRRARSGSRRRRSSDPAPG